MTTPLSRRLLPLLGAHSGRSRRTCELKCGSACFHPVPNHSDNEYFADVVESTLTRRSVLRTGATALVIGAASGAGLVGSTGGAAAAPRSGRAAGSGTGLRFTPIDATQAGVDKVVLPAGYDHGVLVRWGDPILPGAPEFDQDGQTAQAQAGQFGYNCDYVAFLPLGQGDVVTASAVGLLTVNHEYTNPELMFADYDPLDPTREQVDIELAAHGLSIVEVERPGRTRGGYVVRRNGALNRRITAQTPILISGPAAGHDWLRTADDPTGTSVLGTLNNCGGGTTPWGTVLSAEENFNQYFANLQAVTDPAQRAAHERYGFRAGPSERQWERYHDRFDLAKTPHEPFRFGWVVEIDPQDPSWQPRKRTALGRLKHEAATVSLSTDGRVVAYTGDDERFDYVYKFVSRDAYREGDPAHNRTLLDAGDLFVARFTGDSPQAEIDRYNAAGTLGQLPDDGEFDGVGQWLPLVQDGESRVTGMSVAEVLINTRTAADQVGATKMDRPEDVQRSPVNGRVYMAMTNNTNRGKGSNPGPDEANPRRVDEKGAVTGNKYGHVVELAEDGNDGAATTFRWRLFLVCGKPTDPTTYFAGFDKAEVSPIAAPDNLAFDPQGNLWIATDGQGSIGKADAFHAVAVSGSERGRVRQYLSVPAGAEACGPEFTPDGRALFCSVQHPGDGAQSNWPDRNANPPRPSVIATFRATGDPRIGA